MSYQKENFGMMDEGYFVPRGELIDWINQILDVFFCLLSSTSRKSNNLAPDQSTVKLLMSFIQAKSQ